MSIQSGPYFDYLVQGALVVLRACWFPAECY